MVAVTHSPAREVRIAAGGKFLEGTLTLPEAASAVVVFAHGSGSSRHSPRNRLVADAMVQAGIGTLLFDLLSAEEEEERFNIDLLACRLEEATLWLTRRAETHALRVGYFGASTGAAAALVAAARLREQVDAVVSRGGRPDLAGPYLPKVVAPTLLIVGALDREVITLNEKAYAQLTCTRHSRSCPARLICSRSAARWSASPSSRWNGSGNSWWTTRSTPYDQTRMTHECIEIHGSQRGRPGSGGPAATVCGPR